VETGIGDVKALKGANRNALRAGDCASCSRIKATPYNSRCRDIAAIFTTERNTICHIGSLKACPSSFTRPGGDDLAVLLPRSNTIGWSLSLPMRRKIFRDRIVRNCHRAPSGRS